MIVLENFRRQQNTFIVRIFFLLTTITVIAYTEILERLDFVVYDEILHFIDSTNDSNIVIVTIDEKSLSALGSWPWSRGVHAALINRLTSIGNKVVALDLLFSELQSTDAHADLLLAKAIATHGNVILPVAPISNNNSGALYLTAPHPIFRQHAVLGHVDIELDSDGVARRVFLYAGIDVPAWPALALVLADPSTAGHSLQINDNKKGDDRLKHWVRAEETLIPYTGKLNSFRHVSYSDVLFNDAKLADLKGKTVIVGMTAAGMGTRFATPLSADNRQSMTGVEWHANVYVMLQNNHAIHPLPEIWVTILSFLWVAIILTGVCWTKNNFTVPLLAFFMVAGLFLVYQSLKIYHVWIPPSAALLGTLAIYPLWNWRRVNQFIRAFLITQLRSSTALEAIQDGVIITDAHDHVVYINRGAEKILRTEFNQIKGKVLQQILHLYTNHNHRPEDRSVKKLLAPGLECPGVLECGLKTTLNTERTVRITRNQLHDEHKALIGSVIAITDITDTVELTQRIAHHEDYDALTKLPNRTKLMTQFDQLIQVAQITNKTITIFFITLDNFKKINDAMGHQAGDKLLRMVSDRLNESVNQDDIVARWGGDEFILLSVYLTDKDIATGMAQKLLEVIRSRFEIDSLEVYVSVSIGISFYPENGLTSDTILERARTAMYRVKRDGGNCFNFYSPESTLMWTRDRLELEKELRAAITNHELQVLFQPIVHAETHHIARMEALVRWPHSARGFLSPSEFIPLAENVGLIDQLGELVLRTSCLASYKLLKLGYSVNVSVNVSPRQLLNKNFLQTIINALHDSGLPPRLLILEITESAIVNDMERVGNILTKIRELDILIALDDFGTGYSSLTLLRELPIDIIKIDKSFVRTLDQNQNDLTIVQAIIGLGINLGLLVVAEGVETAKQARILLQHHCYYQQGYYFSRPIPYQALLELINKKR